MTFNREATPTKLTKPHKMLHALLATMGFEVEDEVEVGKYRLDCFVREVWCGFECDGKRVHAGQKKQERDRARDLWIYENAGIPVMRIQADALQHRLWDQVKGYVEEFVTEHASSLGDRKAKGRDLV